MTPAQLLELRALADAATPGPWRFKRGAFDGGGGHVLHAGPNDEQWHDTVMIISHLFAKNDVADYSFIAASRSAVPALLDRVAELEAGLLLAIKIARAAWTLYPDEVKPDRDVWPQLDALAALVTK